MMNIKMKMLKLALASIFSVLAIGCKNLIAEQPVKATLTNPTEKTLQQIRKTIKQALNGREITIADSVFSNSHRLLLDRKKHIGPDGRPIQTGVDEEPIVFELYKDKTKCFILDLRNQKRFLLKDVACKKN